MLDRIQVPRLQSILCRSEKSFFKMGEVTKLNNGDFYIHKDRGSNVLGVAHLDSVHTKAKFRIVHDYEGQGPLIYSPTLDDRLGAYIIIDLLPALGINCDFLLTTGEESGQSTGEDFESPKDYNWMFQFDRGEADVVMYQYAEDDADPYIDFIERQLGITVNFGLFSDISSMEHLAIKGFNWGCCYQDYHSSSAHVFLDDVAWMVRRFVKFYEKFKDTPMLHEPTPYGSIYGDYAHWGSVSTHDPDNFCAICNLPLPDWTETVFIKNKTCTCDFRCLNCNDPLHPQEAQLYSLCYSCST